MPTLGRHRPTVENDGNSSSSESAALAPWHVCAANGEASLDEGSEILEPAGKVRDECGVDAERDDRGMYYAVRVGYASPVTDDEDGVDLGPPKKRKRPSSGSASAPMVKIRSAIFLHWEDARQFVDTVSCSSEQKAEYSVFYSFLEAEAYLLDDDKQHDFNSGQPVKKCDSGKMAEEDEKCNGEEVTEPPAKTKKKTVSEWERMYRKLLILKERMGSIEIPEISEKEKEDPKMKKLDALRHWCNLQLQYQRRWAQGYTDSTSISFEKIEKLRVLGLVAPSYEDMYKKLVNHKKENGTLDVKKDDDKELFAWMREQKKMFFQHFAGKPVPLSNEQIQNLKSLGFEIKGRSVVDEAVEEKKWNAMLEALVKYTKDHGHASFITDKGTLSKPERLVFYWVKLQRQEYKKLKQGKVSTLTAQRLQRLTAIGFDFSPRTDHISWEERMQSLREFIAEHGHCRPNRDHPLGHFVRNMRSFYRQREGGKKTCLTDERVNDLIEIGFEFKVGKTPVATVKKSWEERYQELLAYKEENGHTLVPQLSGTLGRWVAQQRKDYQRMKAGKHSPMTAERALTLTEIGFHFEAERFRGAKFGDDE